MANLVAMPLSRKEMEKHQNVHTRQVEHATKQWEARENKVANNKKQKQWIERQKTSTTETNTIGLEVNYSTREYRLELFIS